ncbi:hypothetical protein OCU04_008671 [Sclerotinia nivalis]|uniref:Cytochrome P450 n=1 Tax=Sclerotinia nivalis TaxID=352851 RepID=A0A9X0AGC0_9HELO|nr:hypothetical protein OCU04_008671 [Sclerotinia nivalis]
MATLKIMVPWQDQILLLALVLASIVLLRSFLNSLHQGKESAKVWNNLQVVGLPSTGIFSWTRALFASILSIPRNTHDGYERICKTQGRPFALPTMWMGTAVVVLPPSLLSLLNKPDSELSGFKALLDTIQLPYMISDRDIYENVIHFDVVRKKLTRKDVGSLAVATAEEIDFAFRDSWGTSNEWKNVNGWDAAGRIITCAALRILIGLPFCRNGKLFEQSQLYANSLFAGTVIINCLPPSTRPFLAPLLALRAKYYQARCQKILEPYVEERIRQWEKHRAGDDQPNDFLQWMIVKCSGNPLQMKPTKLAMRLLALNTMFVFAMGYVFAHCVLDLYASPSKIEFVEGLKEECRHISEKYNGLSTKEAVDSLYRIDSTVRESMRISDVGVTTLPLEVMDRPIDLGNGIIVPRGVRMVFPTQPMHLDPSYYDDPLTFDAFRFSRKFENLDESSEKNSERELLTSPTKFFLAFGYGRHGCPGRWFVSQTIKQALAYVVLNYDIEIIGEVKRKSLLNMMVPPTDAQIKIRRIADRKN